MTTDQDQPLNGDRQRPTSLRSVVPNSLASFRNIAILAAVLALLGAAYVIGDPAPGAQPGTTPG